MKVTITTKNKQIIESTSTNNSIKEINPITVQSSAKKYFEFDFENKFTFSSKRIIFKDRIEFDDVVLMLEDKLKAIITIGNSEFEITFHNYGCIFSLINFPSMILDFDDRSDYYRVFKIIDNFDTKLRSINEEFKILKDITFSSKYNMDIDGFIRLIKEIENYSNSYLKNIKVAKPSLKLQHTLEDVKQYAEDLQKYEMSLIVDVGRKIMDNQVKILQLKIYEIFDFIYGINLKYIQLSAANSYIYNNVDDYNIYYIDNIQKHIDNLTSLDEVFENTNN